MKTRSQIKSVNYEVDIDFDSASKAWNANKIKLSDGMYKYKKNGNNTINNTKNTENREPTKNEYNLRSRKTI